MRSGEKKSHRRGHLLVAMKSLDAFPQKGTTHATGLLVRNELGEAEGTQRLAHVSLVEGARGAGGKL